MVTPLRYNPTKKLNDLFINSLWPSVGHPDALDFPRFSRQLIMSEITKRKLNERHQIYRRV